MAESSFDGTSVAFTGYGPSGQIGVYTDVGGALHAVADQSTPVPGGAGTFLAFFEVSADEGSVAFFGAAVEQHGIYTNIGGPKRVADTRTAVPGGHGTITSFIHPALSDDNVAFHAGARDEFGEAWGGIYAQYDGSLIKIIDSRDLLDGKTIYNTSLSDEALDGNLLAFLANFQDGSSGIFIAVIPEPTTLLLLAAAGLTLLGGRRHARQRKRCQENFPEWSDSAA